MPRSPKPPVHLVIKLPINQHIKHLGYFTGTITPGVIGAHLHQHIAGFEQHFRVVQQHGDLAGEHDGVDGGDGLVGRQKVGPGPHGNRPGPAPRRLRAPLADLESSWAGLNALAAGHADGAVHAVLRDGHCHEAVMWYVHHLSEDMKAVLSESVEVTLPLLGYQRHECHGREGAMAEVCAAYEEQVTCQSCHSNVLPPGHAFLLAAPKDEYVALRILSVKSADEGGRSRVTDAELFARAKTRVDRRPNGDVILKDIPMVNQGPKGYCVPATWERAMRSMGVPADMYVLAMAGQSGAGGGTL